MSNCGIYKITSPTGKIYIGQTNNIKRRFNEYRSIRNVDNQPKLYNSLKKYGWKSHNFEIIEECEFDELLCRERYWQDFYDVIGENGLNCMLTKADNLPQRMSEETKKKISEKRKGVKGRKHTEETKKKISSAHKGKILTEKQLSTLRYYSNLMKGSENGMKGKRHSEESKQKIRESKIGRKLSEETRKKISDSIKGENHGMYGKKHTKETCKKISHKLKEGGFRAHIVLDLNTGVFYRSIREASEYHNISNTYLARMLKGIYPNKTSLTLA